MQVNTEILAAEVAKRKCLWDPSDEDYKIREAKLKAWEEVAEVIFDDFQHRNADDKDEMSKSFCKRVFRTMNIFMFFHCIYFSC